MNATRFALCFGLVFGVFLDMAMPRVMMTVVCIAMRGEAMVRRLRECCETVVFK